MLSPISVDAHSNRNPVLSEGSLRLVERSLCCVPVVGYDVRRFYAPCIPQSSNRRTVYSYSGAIFDDEAKGSSGDLIESRPIAPPRQLDNNTRTIPPDDLERGQLEKLHLVARRARIKKGSRVLEIGWARYTHRTESRFIERSPVFIHFFHQMWLGEFFHLGKDPAPLQFLFRCLNLSTGRRYLRCDS